MATISLRETNVISMSMLVKGIKLTGPMRKGYKKGELEKEIRGNNNVIAGYILCYKSLK